MSTPDSVLVRYGEIGTKTGGVRGRMEGILRTNVAAALRSRGIEADAESMVLLERRDKPACSPIGMQGMCGRGYLDRRPILIDDVRTLGENYIACDPRDLSEIVVPLFENDGSCWGVLDGDSYETGAFTEADVEGMTALMALLGLSVAGDERPGVRRV